MLLGIDEVRKSPAIGSIVVCGFVCDSKDLSYLYDELGVRDSKKIQYKIERLAKVLDKYPHKVFKIPAEEISVSSNINALEGEYIKEIIKWADSLFKIDQIFIDSLTANPDITRSYIKMRDKRFVIEIEADNKYVPVMCASIIAKDRSDIEMAILRKEFDCGSGEPADKKTREFIFNAIKENDQNKLKIIRKKWLTFKREYDKIHQNTIP